MQITILVFSILRLSTHHEVRSVRDCRCRSCCPWLCCTSDASCDKIQHEYHPIWWLIARLDSPSFHSQACRLSHARVSSQPGRGLQCSTALLTRSRNHSFDNIAGDWDFHPNINNLVNHTYCNEVFFDSGIFENLDCVDSKKYTNANWTVWGEALNVCAGPYEQEVPLVDPDHNFA